MTSPLTGLRVVDLSRVLAGPYCTMLLADLGADVVKVERPGTGDETRSWGPPFVGDEAAYYLAVNRGKRSCAIDLSLDDGRALAEELCAGADVVVENFRPGGAERLGLGYADLRARNERLVYCSVRAFGRQGPLAGAPGYDPLMQAFAGIVSITGEPDQSGVRVGASLVDIGTGVWAALGIYASIRWFRWE